MTVEQSPGSNREQTYSRRMLLFALIGLCLLFVGSYSHRLNQRAQVESEIATWELRIEQARQKQLELKAELEYVTTADYLDEIARERFGMAMEGDTIIVVLTATPVPAPVVVQETPVAGTSVTPPQIQEIGTPHWQQWLSIFAPNRTE